jgi:2'-5' RNA ligase
MRLFFSIIPPNEFKRSVNIVQERLRGQFKGVFVDPRKFHVTVLFLGEVEEDRIEEIRSATERVSKKFSSFTLITRELNRLGESVVVSFEDCRPFSKFSDALRDSLKSFVPAVSVTPQIPHITLLRFRKTEDTKLLQPYPFNKGLGLALPISSFHLVESRPVPSGHIYASLFEFRLI